MSGPFSERISVEQVEESNELAPKFDVNGLIPVVTTDHETGELLMHGFMNEAAFLKSIETAEAHYYSRSRETVWHKGVRRAAWFKISLKCGLMMTRTRYGCV